ncbi:MAG: hypothetical protein LC122_12860 [Chitinophagales bacterium]|nr:hypothetical protein [Chitinophagales bacterium]
MDLKKLATTINAIQNTVNNNEVLSTSLISKKLSKLASVYPEDKTIGAMMIVFDKIADTKPTITRKEFKDMYNKHYTYLTTFANHFSDELGIVKKAEVKVTKEHKELNINDYRDSTIVDTVLNKVFASSDKSIKNPESFKKAEGFVSFYLDSIGIKPQNVKCVDCSTSAFIVSASYETPKGSTQIYIPLSKNMEASVFVGNDGPVNIGRDSIISYIKSNAGKKIKYSTVNILGALEKFADSKVSDAEIAASKLKLKGAEVFAAPTITGQEIKEVEQKDLNIPKLSEASSFEERFTSSKYESVNKYGEELLQKAASAVDNTLNGLGINAVKIKVGKPIKNGVMFSVVSTDQKTFQVPVKFANNLPLSPEVALINGNLSKLDKTFVNVLSQEGQDKRAFASAYDLCLLADVDLFNYIKNSVMNNEMDKAQAGLLVLKDRDEKLYREATQGIINGLFVKTASVKHQCSKIIKLATSKYHVCGHTGLPLNKIKHDEYGNCIPVYRSNVDDSYEGGYFMTSKILG